MIRRVAAVCTLALALGGLSAVAVAQVPGGPTTTTTKDPGTIVNQRPFNVDAYVTQVRNRFGVLGQTPPVGFALAVAHDGAIVRKSSFGVARRAIDGQVPFTENTRMEVMSVTKPMTALALLKLLDVRKISVDAPIWKYLPGGWKGIKGFSKYSVNPITFRQLLTHTSGLKQAADGASKRQLAKWTNRWDGLKYIAEHIGATPTPTLSKYKNANLALARVLIPQLWRKAGGPDSTVTAGNHWKRTQTYVNQNVFAPAGVPYVRCWDLNDTTATMAYDVTTPTAAGRQEEYNGDDRQGCGGATGFHLSAVDLAKVLMTMRHTTKILPAAVRTAMFTDRLGWQNASNRGDNTGFWFHGGDGDWGAQSINTCVAVLPRGYEAAVVLNSSWASPIYQCTVLVKAFQDVDALS